MSDEVKHGRKDLTTVNFLTRFPVKEIRVKWVVENFDLLDKSCGERITSSSFCLPGDKSRSWSLWLYPNGNKKDASEYVSIYLCKNFIGRVSTVYDLSLLGSNDEKVKSETVKQVFSEALYMNWGVSQYVKRKELLEGNDGCLVNGNLIISLELKVLENEENCSSVQSRATNVADWEQSELCSMLDNTDTSDVRLTVGEKVFAVHKTVLSARSPVFAAMFKHDLKEMNSGEVNITDISAEVMGEVVRYIYTGLVPERMGEMAEELLAAADKYDLRRLKEKCGDELLGRLAVDTAPQLLLLADTHQAADMKTQVMEFISRHARQVLEHPSWKEVTAKCGHLGAEVNAFVLNNLLCIVSIDTE